MTVHEPTAPTDPRGGRPVVPSRSLHRPLGLGEIALGPGFWEAMQRTNAAATLGHCEAWMERLGWLANFDRAAAGTTGPDRPGWSFSDSEVYKLLEAAAWEYGRSGDPAADRAVRRLTARIAPAQDADGYLNTCFGHPGRPPRYSDLETGHELYCTGHLLQAAVARLRTVGPDPLTAVARRAADQVCAVFGPERDTGAGPAVGGHPEIELGLVELGRALGEERYTAQARLFLDRRGRGTLRGDRVPSGAAYFQDDVPVRDAEVWRGHAVRALYLAAAAADVAAEQGDDGLHAAVERQWARTVGRRTYLTGGMGARHQDEGFGEDWELPADRAYCESCAGIASVMVSWRLFLASGDMRYADLMERTLYNVVAAAPSADGRAFFYANPLHQRAAGAAGDGGGVSPRAETGVRAPWFDVSCCPTNLARTLAVWHTYAAAAGRRELAVLQYANARIRAELGDGRVFGVEVETGYPADGEVAVRVTDPPEGAAVLRLRVPGWAAGAVLEEGGRRRRAGPGAAVVEREFTRGEVVRLRLPVGPRFTWPDPRIDAVRGCVAVERGPLVYCAESIDLPEGAGLDRLAVDTSAAPADTGDGRVRVRARALREPGGGDGVLPYGGSAGSGAVEGGEPVEAVLTPYHQWAERGPTAMRVWLPAFPLP
ncbi:glycoside hydrolase family 127 protein [Nocardiopsis suaedae]|uniref:Glycoside hydrolase family 127 protein n=1 Tax=Nocardiopsis suaedae TaxID=3018444 RepID=A0ABT4THR0_9ACTN|nr:beta-L-arabinofuranosidase domain-containing protein [Nocardiopsis suaedae]MDA2804243.1 glycoside hydrolase family 127 protein [Nocardiopsis suaedae]